MGSSAASVRAGRPLQVVLSRLEGVRREGSRWKAPCPCHGDTDPSLYISEASDGKVLLRCFADCDTADILTAIGLEWSDLFPDSGPSTNGRREEIVATYDYVDEHGELLYQAVRFFPKDFRQRRPDGSGGWQWRLGDVRRVLYGLPQVLEAVAQEKPIYLVEGEKDVDRLAELGLTATTNAMGAGKWSRGYTESLRGARVVILPDNDEAGRKHARHVADELEGVAEDVRIVRLPDLSEKGDVSDWLDAGHTLEELLEVVEEGGEEKEEEEEGPKLFPILSDLEAETIPDPEWGIETIYPQGGLVIVFGQRGQGKTFLVLGWSFCHAVPYPWLTRSVLPGPVAYVMAEGRGGLGKRVRAQKAHLGVEGLAGVHFIPTAVPMLENREVDRLIRTIQTLDPQPIAIVWDTLSRTFIGGDENSSKDMARYVAAIDRVKDEVGGTAIVQHHTGHSFTDRERGSSVLGGAADTIVALREKDGSLELSCEKQKDAPEFSPIQMRLAAAAQSCVLKLHDPAWSNAGFLSDVEFEALRSLHESFLADGAAATTWLKASEMAESSFYKARTSLVRRHLVDQKGEGRGARYVITAEGARLLKLHHSMETP